jgi:hypothetical protein
MRDPATMMTRRSLTTGLIMLGGLMVTGCGRSNAPQSEEKQAASEPAAAPQLASMTVYRDPSCGCCEAWAAIARNAGFEVTVSDHPDMASIKRQYGVPDELVSCHTTVVGDYAVEGHVPLEDVARLLRDKPADIKGIAVPGMPLGSPGMEVPDGTKQPFQVMAFNSAGEISVFRG